MMVENFSDIFNLSPVTKNDLSSEKSSISGWTYSVDSNVAVFDILKSFVI